MKMLPVLLILFLFSSVVTAASEQKLFHDVRIADLIITAESLRCSKEVLVLVDVVNAGSFTEDVYVELLNIPLGVHAFSPSTKVFPRSREQVLIPLYFSQEPQGTSTFDAYLYSGDKIQQVFQSFTFAGCKTVQLTSYIQPQLPPQIQQQSSPTSSEQPLDLLFVGTFFLVILLAVLASLALIRLF